MVRVTIKTEKLFDSIEFDFVDCEVAGKFLNVAMSAAVGNLKAEIETVEETVEEPVEERVEAVEEKKEVVIEQNLCGSVEDLNAEEIHVQFLERLCRQFDADEIDAHVKVVYKKKNEKNHK